MKREGNFIVYCAKCIQSKSNNVLFRFHFDLIQSGHDFQRGHLATI